MYHVSCMSCESDGMQAVVLTQEHKPLRFTCAHSHASCQIENRLGRQAFVLSFGLSISCTDFIMYLFLFQHNSLFIFYIVLFTIQNYSAGMKQFTINMPALYMQPILILMQVCSLKGRVWVPFPYKIFLNMMQPDIYSMILGTDIFVSFIQSLTLCFDLF